jgi:phosphoglucosamine mutase
LRADAGIVISASHNLFEDNGIKIFGNDGYKLPDKKEKEIEEIVLSGKIESMGTKGSSVGKAFKIGDALGRYIVFLKNSFPKDMTLQGFRIIIDCANGAAYKLAPMVLDELGADVIPLNVKPNGKNINFQCGSTNPGEMREAVKNIKVDLGIALDGDGDRAIFLTKTGK